MKKILNKTHCFLLFYISFIVSCAPTKFLLMESNDITRFSEVIRNGTDINEIPSNENMTILSKSCLWGKIEFVKVCIDAGADVNASLLQSEAEKRPYQRALDLTMNGYGEFSFNTANEKGSWGVNYRPLAAAIEADTNNLAMVTLLLDKGAETNFTFEEEMFYKITDYNYNPSTNYMHFNQYKEYISKTTPLIMAIEKKQIEIVKLLIKKGADINMPSSNGKLPLIYAIDNKDIELIKLLIENGAKIKSDDSWLEIKKEKPSFLQEVKPKWRAYIVTEETFTIQKKLKQINDDNISKLINKSFL